MVGMALEGPFLVWARRSSSFLMFYTFSGAKLAFSSNLSLLVGWKPSSSSPKVVNPFSTPLSSYGYSALWEDILSISMKLFYLDNGGTLLKKDCLSICESDLRSESTLGL